MENIILFENINEYYDNNVRPNISYVEDESKIINKRYFVKTAYFNIPESFELYGDNIDVPNIVTLVNNINNIDRYYINGKLYNIERNDEVNKYSQEEYINSILFNGEPFIEVEEGGGYIIY